MISQHTIHLSEWWWSLLVLMWSMRSTKPFQEEINCWSLYRRQMYQENHRPVNHKHAERKPHSIPRHIQQYPRGIFLFPKNKSGLVKQNIKILSIDISNKHSINNFWWGTYTKKWRATKKGKKRRVFFMVNELSIGQGCQYIYSETCCQYIYSETCSDISMVGSGREMGKYWRLSVFWINTSE